MMKPEYENVSRIPNATAEGIGYAIELYDRGEISMSEAIEQIVQLVEFKCPCGFKTTDGDQLAKHLYKQHLPGNRNERKR